MTPVHSAYGLRILREIGHGALSSQSSDVTWQQNRVDVLPRFEGGVVRPLQEGSRTGVQHIFAAGGRTYATFEVSAEGRTVRSWAVPAMQSGNLEELFFETVMRTVLCRQGLPAFHASAVFKHGGAVLLMGPKGAGKSTLASALQKIGWTLLADDLVRLRCEDGSWCALPGMRRNKLRPDSLRALGYVPENSERRWKGKMPEGAEDLAGEKFMVPAQQDESRDGSGAPGVPVRCAICLMPRERPLGDVLLRELPGRTALLHLAEHLICDPLPPYAPPPAAGRMLGGLGLQSTVWQAQLPNDLERLQQSAAEVDRMLQPSNSLAGL